MTNSCPVRGRIPMTPCDASTRREYSRSVLSESIAVRGGPKSEPIGASSDTVTCVGVPGGNLTMRSVVQSKGSGTEQVCTYTGGSFTSVTSINTVADVLSWPLAVAVTIIEY